MPTNEMVHRLIPLREQDGIIADATILHAPSSTKSQSGQRNPEMTSA